MQAERDQQEYERERVHKWRAERLLGSRGRGWRDRGRGGREEALQSESRRMTGGRFSGGTRRRMTRRGRQSASPRHGERAGGRASACSRFNYSRIDENKSARFHIMKARRDNQKDACRLQSSVSGTQTRCKWETYENVAQKWFCITLAYYTSR